MIFIIPQDYRRLQEWCYQHDIAPHDRQLVVINIRNAYRAVKGRMLSADDKVVVLGHPQGINEILDELRTRLQPCLPEGTRFDDIVSEE